MFEKWVAAAIAVAAHFFCFRWGMGERIKNSFCVKNVISLVTQADTSMWCVIGNATYNVYVVAKGQQNVMIFDERRNIPMNSLAVRKNDTKNVVAFIAIASLAVCAAVLVSANPTFAAEGISTLFGEAGKIANAVMAGFQGLVLTVAIAAGVYTMIRGLMASDPKETAQLLLLRLWRSLLPPSSVGFRLWQLRLSSAKSKTELGKGPARSGLPTNGRTAFLGAKFKRKVENKACK